VRRADPANRGDFFLQPDRDINGPGALDRRSTMRHAHRWDGSEVVFLGEGSRSTSIAPRLGRSSHRLAGPEAWLALVAGPGRAPTKLGPGDVHVAIDGLPRVPALPRGFWPAAALSNPFRIGIWGGEGPAASLVRRRPLPDADERPFKARIRVRADLRFPPLRDETGVTIDVACPVRGRPDCDQRRSRAVRAMPRAEGRHIARMRLVLRPSLAMIFTRWLSLMGRSDLRRGGTCCRSHWVLEKPVALALAKGQPSCFPRVLVTRLGRRRSSFMWGIRGLEGFAVRFENRDPLEPWSLQGGPAVIGATDNLDPGPGDFRRRI